MAALSDNRHGTKPRVTWAGGEPAVGTRTHKLGIQHATSHLTIPHLKLGIQHTTNHLTIPHLKLDIQHATSHFTIPHIKLGMLWEGSSPAVAEVFHAQAHPGSFHTHARALPGSSFSPTPHLSPIHSLSAISYHIQYKKKKRQNKQKQKQEKQDTLSTAESTTGEPLICHHIFRRLPTHQHDTGDLFAAPAMESSSTTHQHDTGGLFVTCCAVASATESSSSTADKKGKLSGQLAPRRPVV